MPKTNGAKLHMIMLEMMKSDNSSNEEKRFTQKN